jgi:hypothetical protein
VEVIMASNQGNNQNKGNSGGNEGRERAQEKDEQGRRSDQSQGGAGNEQSATKPGQVPPPSDANDALSPDRTSSAGS